jgi:hypothetical protein
MKVKMSGTCHIFVEGMEMNCPLCGSLVKSGETHDCKVSQRDPKRCYCIMPHPGRGRKCKDCGKKIAKVFTGKRR